MPKKRQIPRLFPQPLADGRTMWHWKPSKTLRSLGFANVKLGTDFAGAVNQALNLNAQVDAIDRDNAGAGTDVAPRRALPRVVRFSELVSRYKQSEAYTSCKPATRRNYDVRLRQLEHWALDGTLPVRDIDTGLVRDLRNALVAGSSDWTAAGTLRVLRLLLQWAKDEGIIAENPAMACDIPEPKPRRTLMGEPARDAIVAAATALGLDDVAFIVPLAFWMIQRRGDMLALSRFSWREFDVSAIDIDARHLARMVDSRGRLMGFQFQQQKTDAWIAAPVPPMFHATIEERLRRGNSGGFLFPHPSDPTRSLPGHMFEDQFNEARGAAWAVALMEGDDALADALDACQFRDLRRTGMTFYGNTAGARVQWVTALSGHAVLGRRTIMDVYMGGDIAGATACVATGLRYVAEKNARAALG